MMTLKINVCNIFNYQQNDDLKWLVLTEMTTLEGVCTLICLFVCVCVCVCTSLHHSQYQG